MKKLVYLFAFIGLVAGFAMRAGAAPELRALPWQSAIKYGATHVLDIGHADLKAYTATNTTVIFTNTVDAPCAVEFRGMVLDTAFDSTVQTNALSMLLNVGYSSDADKWIDDKQVAGDGTEIKFSFGSDYTVATATTGATTDALVSVSTVTSPLLNEQSADVTLLTSFGKCLDDYGQNILTSGRVRLFFRILQ